LRSIAKWVGIVLGCVMGLVVLIGGWPASIGLVVVGLIVYGIIRLRAEHLMNRVWWTGSTRWDEESKRIREKRKAETEGEEERRMHSGDPRVE